MVHTVEDLFEAGRESKGAITSSWREVRISSGGLVARICVCSA